MSQPTPAPAAVPDVFAINITPEFAAALASFQKTLPKIDKNRLVEVETAADKKDYDYSYATLDHVSEVVMPKLAEHGLSFASFPGVGSGGRGLSLRYFLMHSSGGYIGAEWPIPGSDQKGARLMQAIGGMVTYIRRYALQAATGVSAEDDDDDLRAAAAAEQQTPTAQRRARGQTARTEQAAANTARRREQSDRGGQEDPPPGATPDRPAVSSEPTGPQGFSAPRNPDAPVSQPQQRKLVMQFKDLSSRREGQEEITREERLTIVSGLMGRDITSIKDLTAGEAHEMIEVIDSALACPDPIAVLDEAIRAVREAAASATNDPASDNDAWAAELEQAKRDAGTAPE